MRKIIPSELSKGRIRKGFFASSDADGLMGAFTLTTLAGEMMKIISSGPMDDWEHVSVSFKHRCPTWEEMCKVKDLFWGEDECVIQYHPPKKDYINAHPYCLHLWKPVGVELPMPPKETIA